MQQEADRIAIKKYKNTRYWSIWIDDELLAVVCYRKGALAIKQALLKWSALEARKPASAQGARSLPTDVR